MEVDIMIGKSEITNIEVEKQVNELLEVLRAKKQTYAVNKFVLEKTIENLQEVVI